MGVKQVVGHVCRTLSEKAEQKNTKINVGRKIKIRRFHGVEKGMDTWYNNSKFAGIVHR